MRIPNTLKQAALAAFEAGGNWTEFVVQHGHAIAAAEPFDRAAYQRMRGHLLHLVCSGESSGQFPPNDDDGLEPWDIDDEAESTPHDTHTAARYVAPTLPIDLPEPAEHAASFDVEPMRQTTMFNATEPYQ